LTPNGKKDAFFLVEGVRKVKDQGPKRLATKEKEGALGGEFNLRTNSVGEHNNPKVGEEKESLGKGKFLQVRIRITPQGVPIEGPNVNHQGMAVFRRRGALQRP